MARLWHETLRTPAVSVQINVPCDVSSMRASRSTRECSSSLKTRPGEPGSKDTASTASVLESGADSSRVSIAPLRYGSGVKGKVNQSMSHGLPCVVTSVAAEGLEAKPGLEIVIADGAEDFAASVVNVYRDAALWQQLSVHSLKNIDRTFSMRAAEEALKAVLYRHEPKSPSVGRSSARA